MVGAVRFELTTSCTRNKRASQATLRPDPGRAMWAIPGSVGNGFFEIGRKEFGPAPLAAYSFGGAEGRTALGFVLTFTASRVPSADIKSSMA